MAQLKFKNANSVPNSVASVSKYSWNGWEIKLLKGKGALWYAKKEGHESIQANTRQKLEDKLLEAESQAAA